MQNERLRAALLAWYRANRRELPWRERRDAYGIWVSEVMLQQTRVDTVIPYYARFLERFPTVEALASADGEAVRAAWSGLGYYRRAKLMHEAARAVRDGHGGAFPARVEGLEGLPGFGPYTAGAVASIAFGIPAAAVDGNVARVLARLDAVEGDVSRGAPAKTVRARAAALAALGDAASAGDWTQALMELGATICTPRAPRCGSCPLEGACAARAQGRTAEIPPPRKRPERSLLALSAAVLSGPRRRVYLAQRPAEGLFAELWTPPLFEAARPRIAGVRLSRAGAVEHELTHRSLRIAVFAAEVARAPEGLGLRAYAIEELDALGLPSIAWKLMRAAGV